MGDAVVQCRTGSLLIFLISYGQAWFRLVYLRYVPLWDELLTQHDCQLVYILSVASLVRHPSPQAAEVVVCPATSVSSTSKK